MGSLEIETVEPASYYRLREELVEAGFESSDGGQRWTGPIAEPLREFTDSDVMTIVFRDGWPFLHPELEVPGMQGYEHVNRAGYVCLWAQGDTSQAWRTLDGWHKRIEEWCERQKSDGFERGDATMDAHAYFGTEGLDVLAVAPLAEITSEMSDGECLAARGRWRKNQGLLEIATSSGGGNVRGLWLYRESLDAPPTDIDKLPGMLTNAQRSRVDTLLGRVAKDKKKHRQFLVLAWGRGPDANALAILLDQYIGATRARAMEFAPTDEEILRLRAGDRSDEVAGRKVTVFGAGSVGSQVAVLLAESGIDSLTLVDGERVRPGNVVRHAASATQVGAFKVEATAEVIADHAPWTSTEVKTASSWKPEELRALIQEQDLAIDATGNAGFTGQLALLCAAEEVPLVSAMLFRKGAVGRVQRQAAGDKPLAERDDPTRYPEVPWDEEKDVGLEAGCSAPVNLAPPALVTACAALACEVAVDALLGLTLPDEIHETYRPLSAAPFEQPGRLTSA